VANKQECAINCHIKIEMVATHPDIRLQFQPNQTSASAGRYPLALGGIRARGYPRISAPKMTPRLKNESFLGKFKKQKAA
jgi:hypothetical protein